MLTQEVMKRIPKFSSREFKPEEMYIAIKFFCPWNDWVWYVVEGEELEDGDWKFFGYAKRHFKSLGYFFLSELQEIRGVWGLGIKRDPYFDDRTTLADVMKG
jgi:hypothetical protein